MKNILVVAAHPDDEVLGCGGAIANHAHEGDNVYIVITGEGATSRQAKRDRIGMKKELSILKGAAEKSAEILGAKKVEMLNNPDNRLDSMDRIDLIKQIETTVNKYAPHTVYVHHSGDVNVDHRRLHEAVVTACRPTPQSAVRRLLSFEVASSTEWQTPGSSHWFQPNWFIDISRVWEKKRAALEVYASEMRAWPHARSVKAIEHFVRWRGAQVGCEAAEAFCCLRNIE